MFWVASLPQAEHCWTCWCDCLSQFPSLLNRDISQSLFLKHRAVPDPGRWKPGWAMFWEGAIRVWAPLPAPAPAIKPHLFSFAMASMFQRVTKSTSSGLLGPVVYFSSVWRFHFICAVGGTGESPLCQEAAGEVQLHSTTGPHLKSCKVKSGEIRHPEGKQKNQFGFLWCGQQTPTLFDVQKQKKVKSIPCSEMKGFFCFLMGGFKSECSLIVNPVSVSGPCASPATGDDINKILTELSPFADVFNPVWQWWCWREALPSTLQPLQGKTEH